MGDRNINTKRLQVVEKRDRRKKKSSRKNTKESIYETDDPEPEEVINVEKKKVSKIVARKPDAGAGGAGRRMNRQPSAQSNEAVAASGQHRRTSRSEGGARKAARQPSVHVVDTPGLVIGAHSPGPVTPSTPNPQFSPALGNPSPIQPPALNYGHCPAAVPGFVSPVPRDLAGKKIEAEITNYMIKIKQMGCEGLLQLYRDRLLMICPPVPTMNPSYLNHQDRNRYQDVVCLESTRVILKLNVPPETDYIHANWIRFPHSDRQYIATQSPLENTQGDFWRMIFQEEVPSIMNLTKNVEDNKVKGSQYWPLNSGETKSYGSMFVINKKVEKENEDFTITVLEVLPDGCSNSHICRLYHFSTWPDRGVAANPKSVLKMIRLIRKEDSPSKGPIVVHCSAGVGRTGCILLIDYIVNYLFRGEASENGIDFVEIFTQMRLQRASTVQSDMQFLFSIVSTLQYLKCRFSKNVRMCADIEEIIECYKKIKYTVQATQANF